MFVHLTQTTITESMVVHFEDKTPGVLEFFPGRIRGRTGSYSGHFDRDGMTHITADQRGGSLPVRGLQSRPLQNDPHGKGVLPFRSAPHGTSTASCGLLREVIQWDEQASHWILLSIAMGSTPGH